MLTLLRLQARAAEPRAHSHRGEALRVRRVPQALHTRPPSQDAPAVAHRREAVQLPALPAPLRAGCQSSPPPSRAHRRATVRMRTLSGALLRLQPAESARTGARGRRAVRVPLRRAVPAAAGGGAAPVRRRGVRARRDQPARGRRSRLALGRVARADGARGPVAAAAAGHAGLAHRPARAFRVVGAPRAAEPVYEFLPRRPRAESGRHRAIRPRRRRSRKPISTIPSETSRN